MTFLRSLPALTLGVILSGAATPAIAAGCASGWTGTVNYTRSQSDNRSKTVDRVTGRGTETTNWAYQYNYGAQIAVRALAEGTSAGRASISHASSSTETKSAQDIDVCPQTHERRQVSGNFVTKSMTRGQVSGVEADVHIGVDNDGGYTVSVMLPEIKGVTSGSSSGSYSGQCRPKPGFNHSSPEAPTTIEAVRFGSEGRDRVSPSDPNRLNGSYSKTWQNVTETLSWNLRRCGPALRLVDLKFEDMRFPRWEDWQDISEQRGTIDGNMVRVTAIVANDGGEDKAATVKFQETYKGDKWDGAKKDGLIEELSVNVPAGEQREVKFNWDSSGYAWYDDGRPRLVQRIRADLEDRGKKIDDTTRNLKVAPKPVVLAHGLWSNWRAWETWQNILTTSHSYDWKAFPVGEKPAEGRMRTGEATGNIDPTNTIAQNADELGKYIEYAQKDRNAWHVDIVAHSMGGLISRRYIHAMMPSYADGKPQVSHLVMLGTPNAGSPCADFLSIPLEAVGKSMDALRELRPINVRKFNQETVDRKGVPFSVLAGNPLPPPICKMMSMNDGVVSDASATLNIADHEFQRVLHTDMTGTAVFSSFVKPRLASGPTKARATPQAASQSASASGPAPARIMLIDVDDPAEAADFAKLVKLTPGQTLELALPVKEARNLGVTLAAASTVSATLIDDQGVIAASNLADTPAASQPFRSMFVDRPVVKGRWLLKLHNPDKADRDVIVSTWSSQ
jgi:pimeloyl-ACP methyl ester carboxylesterase